MKPPTQYQGWVVQRWTPAVVDTETGVVEEVHAKYAFRHRILDRHSSPLKSLARPVVSHPANGSENHTEQHACDIPFSHHLSYWMHPIAPHQQKKEPKRHWHQQHPCTEKQYPIGIHARADAAQQRIHSPQPSAFQPSKRDDIDKTDRLHHGSPHHWHTEPSVGDTIAPYTQHNQQQIGNWEYLMPQSIAVPAKEDRYTTHKKKNLETITTYSCFYCPSLPSIQLLITVKDPSVFTFRMRLEPVAGW